MPVIAILLTGEPDASLAAFRGGEADEVGLVLLSYDLRSHESPQIGGRGRFAGYCLP